MSALEENIGVGYEAPTQQLSGRLGSSNDNSSQNSHLLDSQSSRYDTLDETVKETFMRDFNNISIRLKQVLLPRQDNDSLKDYDLWGPLLLCLALAIVLSLGAPDTQSANVFTGIFVIVWCGAAIVTLNCKLLGGSVSFLQSVCVLGYCLFPLNLASIISAVFTNLWLRLVFSLIGFAWATYASIGFLSSVNLPNRRALAVFPIFLFYFFISWMIIVL